MLLGEMITKKFKPEPSSYWLEYDNGLLLVYSNKTGTEYRFINLSKVKCLTINYDINAGTLDMCVLNWDDVYIKVENKTEYLKLSKYLLDCLKDANSIRTTTL